MSNFINELVDIVIRKTSKTDNNFKYNYFDYYSDNMGLLEKDKYEAVIDVINRSVAEIDDIMIKDTAYFLSQDIANENIIPSSSNVKNYVLFCLYVSLIDVKVRRMYFNKHTIVNVGNKVRPDKYLCSISNYKNELQFYAYAKIILQLPLVEKFEDKIRKLRIIKPPMPYFDIIDNVIIYEKPTPLNPKKDPLIDVLKDIVNQLKTINKYYVFEYIDKTSIGRSQQGLMRYFIFSLDTLMSKEEITSHNVYDGRQNYKTISSKDQIRTVIHILSEIYITGTNNYLEKIKLNPFSDYLVFLNNSSEDEIHEKFILYLMNIKNE